MNMNLPLFISINEVKQVSELKEYLIEQGAEKLSLEPSPKWTKDLDLIIENFTLCWKDTIPDSDIEEVLNSIISLVLRLPSEDLTTFVKKLCKLYDSLAVETPRRAVTKQTTLNNLFVGLPTCASSRYDVYMCLLECAARKNQFNQVVTDTQKVNDWLLEWKSTATEQQALWRRLYELHISQENSDRANEAMIKLLTTYTDDAGKAREDAIKCIVSCLVDPNVLTLDYLITLKPIQFLEGEPIHDLLTIFVRGFLSKFLEFQKSHADLFTSLNISLPVLMTKMRLLTLMRIAENKKELEYSVIQTELQLSPDEIEEFLIEAVRQKAVCLHLDQVEKRAIITGVIPQSLGRTQWVTLQEALNTWRSNLDHVKISLQVMSQGAVATPGNVSSQPA